MKVLPLVVALAAHTPAVKLTPDQTLSSSPFLVMKELKLGKSLALIWWELLIPGRLNRLGHSMCQRMMMTVLLLIKVMTSTHRCSSLVN